MRGGAHGEDVLLVLGSEGGGALEEGEDLHQVRRVVVLHLPRRPPSEASLHSAERRERSCTDHATLVIGLHRKSILLVCVCARAAHARARAVTAALPLRESKKGKAGDSKAQAQCR